MQKQLAIEFPKRSSFKREDFIQTSDNQALFDYIMAPENWASSCLIIFGGKGVGKTHLAKIWQAEFQALEIEDTIEQALSSTQKYFMLDDIEDWIGNVEKESDLFHLFNHCKLNDLNLLLSSHLGLEDYNFIKADLSSRLKGSDHIHLNQPDDMLLKAIVSKLFSDYQIQADLSTINYLISRAERSVDSLREIIFLIDKKSLAEQRKVTIPFIRQILDEWSQYHLHPLLDPSDQGS